MATAARVKYPAAWQRCKFDTPLLEAGKAGCVITGGTMPYRKKGRLKSPLLLSLLYASCSIILHIVLYDISGNCINSIVVLCSAEVEFNFIFHYTIIILQLCFCKLYI